MTKGEFIRDFDRLCKGFRYEATPEQAEAWFKRIGHQHAADWTHAVDTLLCGPRFPILDPVLAALDEAGNHRRRLAVERDKGPAARVFRKVELGAVDTRLSPLLFQAIKAFCGRDQARQMLAVLHARVSEERTGDAERIKHLEDEEARLSAELVVLIPQLSEQDLSEFVDRYGAAVAA